MNANLSALNMSHLITPDAPLSPLSDWDQHAQYSPVNMEFGLNYNYQLPSPPHSVGSLSSASPLPVSRVLRNRMTPDSSDSEQQQLCLPTHQLFDMSYAPSPESMSSPATMPDSLPPAQPEPVTVPAKRASSVAPTTAKKPRGTTISTKDFIPPDVTGLSKREARLVKNRAAAFLSRQRKREEFEHMELRVTELEQENARLLAIAQRKQPQEQPNSSKLLSEVDQLRAQLAAAQARERELNEELSKKASQQARVKSEAFEPEISLSKGNNGSMQLPHKSGASLGLMVLLCALPSLLSLPPHSTMPMLNHNALAAASGAYDVHSLASGEFDWLNSGVMDIDIDSQGRMTTGSAMPASSSGMRKLEFVDPNAEALGLSGLDISFDATPSQDGKIRVRIHPSSSSDGSMDGSGDQSMSSADLGPFLGIGSDYGMSSVDAGIVLSPPSGSYPLQPGFDLGYGSDFGSVTAAGSRRRVRIALKSLPGEGREGGEWEVQVC